MVITLIGYRGTGKSTAGLRLAERLGWSFVDADPEIEQRAGKSIAAIFASDGEDRFRNLEEEVLREQLRGEQRVLATGGGAILREANRTAMQLAGPVVWLRAEPETLTARLAADPASASRRPALQGVDFLSEVSEVMAAREPLYRAAASYAVTTEGKTVDQIVDEILAVLQMQGRA